MAKIDVSKIEGYDKMTAEERLTALESFDVPEPSYSGYVKKDVFDKMASELADWKKKHNALLSEEEQKKNATEEEMKSVRTELENLRMEKIESDNRARLIGLGYDETLAVKTAKALANGETEKVFAYQKQHQESLEKKIRADVLKDTPQPASGSGTKSEITKEQFDEMGYTERLTFFTDNPELYKEFTGGNE